MTPAASSALDLDAVVAEAQHDLELLTVERERLGLDVLRKKPGADKAWLEVETCAMSASSA